VIAVVLVVVGPTGPTTNCLGDSFESMMMHGLANSKSTHFDAMFIEALLE
jgi:hypothetical protein